MWFRKQKSEPAEVIRELREQAFSVPAAQVGVTTVPGDARVWLVLLETGYAEAVASLVAIADGTTSLYFSNGQGIIGAGQNPAVRAAAHAFIAATNMHAGHFSPATEHPLPDVGRVRFYARTFNELWSAEAAEKDLAANKHPLSSLFFAGHAVIAAVREASPQQ